LGQLGERQLGEERRAVVGREERQLERKEWQLGRVGWGLLEECVEGGAGRTGLVGVWGGRQDRGRTGLVGVWGGRQDRGMLWASWGGAVQLGRGTFVRLLGRRE